MNCYQASAGELTQQWYVIDATDQVVGRLAAQIAPILMGKHRPTYTPHIDTGDYVIVTNVDKVVFTGNKWRQKFYQHYTGHPGGQRDEAAWKLFQRKPERILQLAVQRMMPKNKIGRHMLGKLKLFVGPTHEHQAQQPIPLDPKSGRPAVSGAIWSLTPEKLAKALIQATEQLAKAGMIPPAVEDSARPTDETVAASAPVEITPTDETVAASAPVETTGGQAEAEAAS